MFNFFLCDQGCFCVNNNNNPNGMQQIIIIITVDNYFFYDITKLRFN